MSRIVSQVQGARALRKSPVVIEALENRQLLSAVLQAKPDIDTLMITGSARADAITVGADDTTIGVTINGVVQQFDKSAVKAIIIRGGGGNDTIKIDETYGQLPVGVQIFGDGGGDQITGSSLNDTLNGGGGLDYLFGGGGDDVLVGGGANDYLWGEAGQDWITGGNGHDALYGGDGNDTLLGGSGNDVILGGTGTNTEDAGGGYNNVNNDYAVGYKPLIHSTTPLSAGQATVQSGGIAGPNTVFNIDPGVGFDVQTVRDAYTFGDLNDGGFTNRGAGQGIAIVIAYHTPSARQDLETFSAAMGLPAPTATSFQQIYATGVEPSQDPEVQIVGGNILMMNGWELEANLDVQWAHAIAPEATIYLVEAASNLNSDLVLATDVASQILMRNHGGGVVNMSLGSSSEQGSFLWQKVFTKKAYRNITYVAASGDDGGIISYPSTSPNVLAVGGTVLSYLTSGEEVDDVAWSGSGGGMSSAFGTPTYQGGVSYGGIALTDMTPGPDGFRAAPDVAFNAGASVAVFNSFATYDFISPPLDTVALEIDSGWTPIGGTSAGSPVWSGIIALANQQRVAGGRGYIGSQIHNMVYSMANSTGYGQYFTDVVSDEEIGGSVYPATIGYDLSTGWGVPKATALVDGLNWATYRKTGTADITFAMTVYEALSNYPGGTGGASPWLNYRGIGNVYVGPRSITITLFDDNVFTPGNIADASMTFALNDNGTFSGIGFTTTVDGSITLANPFSFYVEGRAYVTRSGHVEVSGTIQGLNPVTGGKPVRGLEVDLIGSFKSK